MKNIQTPPFIEEFPLRNEKQYIKSTEEINDRLIAIAEELKVLKEQIQRLVQEKNILQKELQVQDAEDIIPLPLMDRDTEILFKDDLEKAQFMLDLFAPRTDIFAKRGINSKSKKGVGYYPVCLNRWKAKICPKHKEAFNCNNCSKMERKKLEAQDILLGNLKNKEEKFIGAIGIYPLKEGNKTRFIAIDFDSSSWINDARSVLKAARKMELPMIWEKSSSGNGAHLWLLFKEDVPAEKARKLATIVIDKAKEDNPSLSMDSYDRLFPSQDKLSKGGVGNLILMPLVQSAARQGSTVFLDEKGDVIPLSKQLSYLDRIHKMTPEELESFIVINDSEKYSFKLSSEDLNPGWIRKIPKLSPSDFKEPIILYLSSGITFDKMLLSTKAQEALRRIATISNPEYYKYIAQHDGYRGELNSRIPLFDENDRVLRLPRAMLKTITTLLDTIGIQYSISDYRVANTNLKCRLRLDKGLYAKQKEALSSILASDIGILSAAPGFGKTIVSLAYIEARKERALIIVPSVTLLGQWIKEIDKHLEVYTDSIIKTKTGRERRIPGRLDGGHDTLSGTIDVVTIQSIASKIENGDIDFIKYYGVVIIDECHHIAALKMRYIMRNLNPKYVLGLSATPKRADGLEKIVYAECGAVVFSYSSAKLAYERNIQQLFIPHFLNTPMSKKTTSYDFNSLLNHISTDQERSKTIAQDIELLYKEGRKILIFTRRREQNEILSINLSENSVPSVVLDGEMGSKQISSILEKLKADSKPDVIIATDKLLGEGVDIPNLDTIVFASPFMQERIVEQCAGRLLRLSPNKKSVNIHDYIDYRIPAMSRMFSHRISIYKKLGYQQINEETFPYHKIMFCADNFIETLLQDIQSAKNNIIISTTFIDLSNQVNTIFSELKKAAERKIKIELRSSNKKTFELLNQKNVSSFGKQRIVNNARNFIVIDHEISWYGALNPLATRIQNNKTADTSIIRILDKITADCIINENNYLL